ncbi:hypothetical protein HQ865_01245 [Mucilaginibacter mali]|uniref:Uncharacterized protein n=1 Tax=Mucilaginibacter mali TaxID=2740462 RepID=A0A7D4UMT8_9SPHI|nr:hypothetical protein [Mucilaginibacter mali]QKJ28440.1 hypothetical protein HQ865_01245 [Mucilaginibacter mali]
MDHLFIFAALCLLAVSQIGSTILMYGMFKSITKDVNNIGHDIASMVKSSVDGFLSVFKRSKGVRE